MSNLDRFRLLTLTDKDRIRQEIIDNCDLVADCWVYKGSKNNCSYGVKYIQGRMIAVSRFMLCYSTRESLDIKLDACHVGDCPYRACCNPKHLFWGAHADNCKQREEQARLSLESRRLENPLYYPQPALGHETHEQHERYLTVGEPAGLEYHGRTGWSPKDVPEQVLALLNENQRQYEHYLTGVDVQSLARSEGAEDETISGVDVQSLARSEEFQYVAPHVSTLFS